LRPAAPDDPPFHQFWERAKGTLPEKIKEADLRSLNSSLSFLFGRLRQARALFEQEDHGRDAAYAALSVFHMFITLFRKPLDEALYVPVVRLQDALLGLDQGRIDAILRPNRRSGRAPSSQAYLALKGLAAATVQRLLQTGLARPEALRAVAAKLRELGVRPERGSGTVTATTIGNWETEVSSDFGRRGTAAMMYDDTLAPKKKARFAELPKDRARQLALESLDTWVRRTFPELSKPT
jgi:hypothetical protein